MANVRNRVLMMSGGSAVAGVTFAVYGLSVCGARMEEGVRADGGCADQKIRAECIETHYASVRMEVHMARVGNVESVA